MMYNSGRSLFFRRKKEDFKMKKTGLAALLTAGVMIFTSGCGAVKSGKVAVQAGNAKATMNDISLFLSEGDGFEDSKKNYAELMEKTFKYGELGKAMGLELTDEDKTSIMQSKASFARQGGGLSKYKDYLKKAGSSMDFLEMLFTESAYQQKVTEKIEEEIGQDEASDKEVEEYFLENYVRAKHVLVALEEDAPEEEAATEEAAEDTADAENAETDENAQTPEPTPVSEEDGKKGEELANLILEKAQNGEDFDKLVEKYNTDPGMEDNEDGYIFTEGDMVSEFYDCAKELEPGKFGVVKSSYGYHVIQRLPLDKNEMKFSEWFDSNKATVSDKIHQNKIDARLDELCKENGITSSIDWDVVNSFKEDMLVKQDEEK